MLKFLPRPLVRLTLVMLAAPALIQCSGDEADLPAKTYETRGVVQQLPAADQPGAELFIRHEAIPSFESIDGEMTGMKSMTMGFPVTDPGLIEGLQSGDKIAFSLQVDWDGSPPLAVTALEKLPESTPLEFESAAGDTAGEEDSAPHAHHQGHGMEKSDTEGHGAEGHGAHGHGAEGHGDSGETEGAPQENEEPAGHATESGS